jgi:hypothetical protein
MPMEMSICEVLLVPFVYNGRAWAHRTGDPDEFFDLKGVD